MKIKWLIINRFLRLRMTLHWWFEKAIPYMPRIKHRVPKPPSEVCSQCGQPYTKIVAVDTGDGWVFYWECDNDCAEGPMIDGWFPFVFGWATRADLKRIGIEEV